MWVVRNWQELWRDFFPLERPLFWRYICLSILLGHTLGWMVSCHQTNPAGAWKMVERETDYSVLSIILCGITPTILLCF